MTAPESAPLTEAVPAFSLTLKVVADVSELLPYVSTWEELADNAIERNIFYEPWMVLPGLRTLGAGATLRFVLVLQGDQLRGFFPIEMHSRHIGMPVRTMTLWRHKYSGLCTPLLHSSCASECLRLFMDWMMSKPEHCCLMEFGRVDGEGTFHRLLTEQLSRRDLQTCVRESYPRALFRPAATAEEYLATAFSGKKLKEFRRQGKRLAELGAVEHRPSVRGREAIESIDSFLRLEKSGWKGEAGTAMASNEADRNFFHDTVTEAGRRGRLWMPALLLNGQPVMQMCVLTAGSGGYAWKMAFDETYSKHSPGAQFQLKLLEEMHGANRLEWLDSCAKSNLGMMESFWTGRKLIQSVMVAPDGGAGAFWASAFPLIRWASRGLRSLGNRVRNGKRAPVAGSSGEKE